MHLLLALLLSVTSPLYANSFLQLKSLAEVAPLNLAPLKGVAQLSPDEAKISQVCSSHAPILLLDNFSTLEGRVPPTADLDGDGRFDLGHGEVVSALYQMTGKQVQQININGDGTIPHLIQLLEPIAEKLESGAIELAAISLSQTIDVSFRALQQELSLPQLTASNLASLRERTRDGINDLMKRGGSTAYGELSVIFSRIAAHGVPTKLMFSDSCPGRFRLARCARTDPR